MHHFMWNADASSWMPCGSDLVPFGCQHGISSQDLVVLLPDTKHHHPTPPFPLKQVEQQQFVHAEVVLNVCTAPGEELLGLERIEKEQGLSGISDQGAGCVSLVDRLSGSHTPVTVMECQQLEVTGMPSATGTYPAQKQVRPHASIVCKKAFGFACMYVCLQCVPFL